MQIVSALLAIAVVSALSVERARTAEAVRQPPPDPEQGFTPLLERRDLQGWESERLGRNAASVQNGVLTLAGGPGWIHTQKSFADFVLRFDARFRGTQSAFSILVRAIAGKNAPSPIHGYGIAIDGVGDQNQRSAKILVFSPRTGAQELPLTRNVLAERLKAVDDWQMMELTCAGRECTLSVNNGAVASITRLEVPLGHVGFSVAREAVELRNIRVRRTSPIRDGFARGAYMIDDEPDLIAPRVKSERRPHYTSGAMAAKIQGSVLLACLVKEDGTVSEEIALLRSLDSELDREAMLAAREWRFTPATLRGQPVRALVTIELTFTLRR
jgi:TonB family protein